LPAVEQEGYLVDNFWCVRPAGGIDCTHRGLLPLARWRRSLRASRWLRKVEYVLSFANY
jgi:hypothetical protein